MTPPAGSTDEPTPAASAVARQIIGEDGELQIFDPSRLTKFLERFTASYEFPLKVGPVVKYVDEHVRAAQTGIDMLTYLSVQACVALSAENPAYGKLGGSIYLSKLRDRAQPTFSRCAKELYEAGVYSERVIHKLNFFGRKLVDKLCDSSRDARFDIFGAQTLTQGGYLAGIRLSVKHEDNGATIIETWRIREVPQYMYMRMALMLSRNKNELIRNYNRFSNHISTLATPGIKNLGLAKNAGTSSCFLITVDNSIDSIMDSAKIGGIVSRNVGGLGYNMSYLSPKGHTTSTGAKATGPQAFACIYDTFIRVIKQSNTRKGAAAIYMDILHPDCLDFIKLKMPTTGPKERLDDIQTALWMRDLFYERVLTEGGEWCFFSPVRHPELYEAWGEDFRKLYLKLEAEGEYDKKMSAKTVLWHINTIRKGCGFPYSMNGDSVNRKNAQSNIGSVGHSNLCTEIVEASRSLPTQFFDMTNLRPKPPVLSEEELEGKERALLPPSSALKRKRSDDDDDNIYKKVALGKVNPEDATVLLYGKEEKKMEIDPDEIPTDRNDSGYDEDDDDILRVNPPKTGGAKKPWITSVDQLDTSIPLGAPEEVRGYNSDSSNFLDPASCNLATISLPAFLKMRVDEADNQEVWEMDFDGLHEEAYEMAQLLDRLLDLNQYATASIQRRDQDARPLGLGYQGLANVFFKMGIRYGSPESCQLTAQIAATVYDGALRGSIQRAKEVGPYKLYEGSPASRGILQFDMWEEELRTQKHLRPEWRTVPILPSCVDFAETKRLMALYGLRNSLLICIPPTATTSHIMCNYESIDPASRMIFKRKVGNGNYPVMCSELVWLLQRYGLWDDKASVADAIKKNNYSVQGLPEHIVPAWMQEFFVHSLEVDMHDLLRVRLAAAPYVDQAISSNIFTRSIDANQLAEYELLVYKTGAKNTYYVLLDESRAKPLESSSAKSRDFAPDEEFWTVGTVTTVSSMIEKEK